MSDGNFLERYRRALGLPWSRPPESARQDASARPDEEPLPPELPDTPVASISPSDVRSIGTDDAGVRHASLGGLDASVLVQPPRGDGLWKVRGRVWLEDESDVPIRVALVQGEHVLAQTVVAHGERFVFQDAIAGPWSIEFRWGSRVAVLRAEAS